MKVDLVIAIISLSIALSVSFRKEKDKQQTLLSLFSFLIASIFLLRYAYISSGLHIWLRLCIGLLIFLPLLLVFVLSTFLREDNNISIELYTIQYIFAPILIIGLSTPIFNNNEFLLFVIGYVFLILIIIFANLIYVGYKEGQTGRKRLLLASLTGLLAVTTSIISLQVRGSELAAGLCAIFVFSFLYYLSESVINGKLLDIQEFISRILILIVLSSIISLLYWLLVILVSTRPSDMLINSLAVSIAITLLFDRLRQTTSGLISGYITSRKKDFIARIKRLRKDISSIMEAEKILKKVIEEIFASQRVISCGFYILSEDRTFYKNFYSLGRQLPEKIDNTQYHSLIDALNERREVLVREIIEKRSTQEDILAEEGGKESRNREILNALIRLNISLVFPISVENEIYYLLAINDYDSPEPINAEELGELIELCEHISVTLQNLKVFEGIKERDRLVALGEMAAGLAHEIRNPLGAIKGAAQYLNPSNLPQEEAEFLKIIIEETDRLNRILTQFLDYSRPSQCEFSVVNLDNIIKQIIKLYSQEKEQKYIFEYSNTAPDALTRLDTEQFRQVMINIIKNAQEAMPEGGKIEIRVSKEREIGKRLLTSVLMREKEYSENIYIDITDNGIGIEEKDLNKIFIPFFTTKKSGTGLGLAISKKIIESHGGRLEINSKKELGTTVRIILPCLGAESIK